MKPICFFIMFFTLLVSRGDPTKGTSLPLVVVMGDKLISKDSKVMPIRSVISESSRML